MGVDAAAGGRVEPTSQDFQPPSPAMGALRDLPATQVVPGALQSPGQLAVRRSESQGLQHAQVPHGFRSHLAASTATSCTSNRPPSPRMAVLRSPSIRRRQRHASTISPPWGAVVTVASAWQQVTTTCYGALTRARSPSMPEVAPGVDRVRGRVVLFVGDVASPILSLGTHCTTDDRVSVSRHGAQDRLLRLSVSDSRRWHGDLHGRAARRFFVRRDLLLSEHVPDVRVQCEHGPLRHGHAVQRPRHHGGPVRFVDAS